MDRAEKPENIEAFNLRAYMKMSGVKFPEPFVSESSIKIIYNFLKNGGDLPLPPSANSKDPKKSIEVAIQGSQHYSSHSYFKAFECFNLAVARAPGESEELAKAFDCRSAALFKLNRFESCIRDVDRALAIACDETRKKKLVKRREACLNSTKCTKEDGAAQRFKQTTLSSLSETKPDIPCASKKLTLAYDTKKGRKIIANDDIKPGEVLVIEEPYVTILRPERYLTHCYNCLVKCNDLIPCDSCSYIMFCSDECKTKARDQYHQYECPIMYYLTGMEYEKIELMALRIVLKARREFESWAAFRQAVEKLNAESDPLTKGFVDNIYSSESFTAIYAMITNEDKRGRNDLFEKMFSGVVLSSLLKEHTDFLKGSSDEDVWFAGLMLTHFTMVAADNLHNVEDIQTGVQARWDPSYLYGCGAYAFFSLFNHSCDPNVCHESFGTTAVMFSILPIKKGEEVCMTYGLLYGSCGHLARQRQLLQRFKFTCECRACVNYWVPQSLPTYAVKRLGKLATGLSSYVHQELLDGDQDVAETVLNDTLKKITALNEYKPCQELIMQVETLKQCYGVLCLSNEK